MLDLAIIVLSKSKNAAILPTGRADSPSSMLALVVTVYRIEARDVDPGLWHADQCVKCRMLNLQTVRAAGVVSVQSDSFGRVQPDPPGLNQTTLASSPPGEGRPLFWGRQSGTTVQ